jgi:hypothetical protein
MWLSVIYLPYKKKANAMRNITLTIIALLTGWGTCLQAQLSGDYIGLIASHHMVTDAAYSAPVRAGSLPPEGWIDGYHFLKEGVIEGIQSQNEKYVDNETGLSNEELARLIVVYPDPAVGRTRLKIPGEIRNVLSAGIYNMDGRKVRGFGERIKGGEVQEIELDVNDLVPGYYYFWIETATGRITRSFQVGLQ